MVNIEMNKDTNNNMDIINNNDLENNNDENYNFNEEEYQEFMTSSDEEYEDNDALSQYEKKRLYLLHMNVKQINFTINKPTFIRENLTQN